MRTAGLLTVVLLMAVLVTEVFSLGFEPAGHSYGEQHYAVDCLQCQLDNTPVALHAISEASGDAFAAANRVADAGASPANPHSLPTARGPPAFSC